MEASGNGSEIPQSLAGDERWALVQRVVSSRLFVKAPQLRDILLYLCRRALEDGPVNISEYEVGCNVLGRRADFNPNEDNIVRVQARHLRKKLEDYFATEGTGEPIVLTIPKGGYLPHFESRAEMALRTAAEADEDHLTHVTEARSGRPAQAPAPAPRGGFQGAWIAVLSLLWVLSAALALHYWLEKEDLRARLPAAEERVPASDDVLWPGLFVPGQPTSIVVSDSCLSFVQDVLKLDLPLREAAGNQVIARLADSVRDRALRAALATIANRQYTSLGDANVATSLCRLARRYNVKPQLRFPRSLDTREFKTGNFVMIGSRRGIPWIQLFEPQLNFHLEQSGGTGPFVFVNRSPQPGEDKVFGGPGQQGNSDQSYADIALLPNLEGNGRVLLISGITMEATEAAGELVMSNEFSTTLAELMRHERKGTSSLYVELLVQAKTLPGMARVSRIICHRWLMPQQPGR